METIHFHHDPQKNNISVLLLLLPSIIFVLIMYTFFYIKTRDTTNQIATESNPTLGSEFNFQNYSVLGEQDSIDTDSVDYLK